MEQATFRTGFGAARRFLTWCAKEWEASIEADEIAALDEETVRQIAKDCAISPDDLLQLAKAGPYAAEEMIEMMRLLDIEPDAVAMLHPALFREMQITCSKCQAKDHCRHELATRAAVASFDAYCGNAESLEVMRADRDLVRG